MVLFCTRDDEGIVTIDCPAVDDQKIPRQLLAKMTVWCCHVQRSQLGALLDPAGVGAAEMTRISRSSTLPVRPYTVLAVHQRRRHLWAEAGSKKWNLSGQKV